MTSAAQNPSPVLLASILEEQRNAIKSQEKLANSLKPVVEALNKTSNVLRSSNIGWRQSVLDSTIADIIEVPATLDTNKDLVWALSLALAKTLPEDPAFLKRIVEAQKE